MSNEQDERDLAQDERSEEQDARDVNLNKESVNLQDAFLLFAGEVKGLRQVIEASYVSAQEAQVRDKKTKRRGLIAIVAATLALIFAGTGSWFAVEATEGNRTVIDQLDECVTPSTEDDPHECFDDTELRLAEAIAELEEGSEQRNQRLVDAFNEWFAQVEPGLPPVVLEQPNERNG